MNKKVYYVWGSYDGCNYVRCLMPTIYNGWDGDKVRLLGEIDRNRSAQGAIASDIVVFQRPDDSLRYEAALNLKALGKKIVFENDDTYLVDDAMKLGGILRERTENLNKFIEMADLVTTTTEFLADEYRKINPRVVVIPNCVDPNDWPEPLRNESKKVRIGFVGSVTASGDYEVAIPLLDELNKRNDVQIVMFGLPAKHAETEKVRELYKEEAEFWEKYNIEWQPIVNMHEYFDVLNELRLDIMVIPRKDNYFNRCKSNVKFLEAAMLEIPVVAQSFEDGLSPYDKDIDSMNGMLARTSEDFKQAVNFLINNKDIRRKMGKEAYKYVLGKYNIEFNHKRWADAYNKMYEGNNNNTND